MAMLYTSMAPGAADHPLRNWLKQLVSHPLETLSIDDARNWSQRGFSMLCMRDHDDSLDLYWKDGMLRSKPGSAGAPPTYLELAKNAPFLFNGLTTWSLPLTITALLAAAASLVFLLRDARRGARVSAAAAVTLMIISWCVAHGGYILQVSLTVSEAAAPSVTIVAMLFATILAVVLVFPAIGLLFVLDQKGLFPEEGTADVPGELPKTT